MPDPKHLKVIAVGPKDVEEEILSLGSIINSVNQGLAAAEGLFLDKKHWIEDAYPAPSDPQAHIDSVLGIDKADIVIGIFWARLGTPVHDAGSGTEHELNTAWKAYDDSVARGDQPPRPWVMVYFNSQPIPVPSKPEDAEQLTSLLRFKQRRRGRMLGEYTGIKHFSDRVLNDLNDVIRDKFTRAANADWSTRRVQDAKLYTFCGLQQELLKSDTFQDFRIDRETRSNINAVSYLWSDVARGGSITAKIDEQGAMLVVEFVNSDRHDAYPSNIAIRGMNERAVDSSRSRLLKLQARIPFLAKGDGPEIYIGLRVVNGWLQHWIYGEGTCYTKTRIAVGPEWTDITADLTSSNWWLFQSDGNHIRGWGPNTPDFQIIAGVVLEFGGPGGDRCGPGRATVHIRNVRLIPNTG